MLDPNYSEGSISLEKSGGSSSSQIGIADMCSWDWTRKFSWLSCCIHPIV